MRAYLAGAIEHAPDGGEAWRKDVKQMLAESLAHSVYDPTDEEMQVITQEESGNFRRYKSSDFNRFQPIIRKIIDHDIRTLTEQIDYVICLWDEHVKHGGGTQGELTLAYHHKIPVYLVTRFPTEEISSWILGCTSNLFNSFNELRQYLIEKYGQIPEKP